MKYFRIFCAQFALILMIFTAVPVVASAHVLKQDNGISAVLHVPPNDNPVAGEQTELNIAFGDKSGTFDLMNCSCQVLIRSDGQTLRTLKAEPALEGATQDSAVDTTFPKPGIYHVIIQGSATNNTFKSFKLDFPLRVSADSIASSSKPSSEVAIIAAGSLIILGTVAYTSISYGGRYRRQDQSK